MDLIGYSIGLNSLIIRYTVLIIVQIISIILLSALLWILPYFEIKMIRKQEKRNREKPIISKKLQLRVFAVQVVVTIFLVVMTEVIGNILPLLFLT